MIGLSKQGKQLDMKPDSRISLRLINPLFSKEKKDNSHSLSFPIPDTPRNQEVLGDQASPQAVGLEDIHDNITLLIDHTPLRSGTLQVLKASPEGDWSTRFLPDSSSLEVLFAETLLKEIDLGGDLVLPSADTALLELSFLGVPPQGKKIPLSMTLNGIPLSEEWRDTDTVLSFTNRLIGNLNSISILTGLSATQTGSAGDERVTITSNTAGAIQPFDIIVTTGSGLLNYTITDLKTSGEISQAAMLLHMDDVAANPSSYGYSFPPVFNLGFYQGQNDTWSGYINLYEPGQGYVGNNMITGESWRTTCIPFIKVGYLFERILAHYGYRDGSSFTQTTDFGQLQIYNAKAVEQSESESLAREFNSFFGKVAWLDGGFNLSDHVDQEATVSDFFRALEEALNVVLHVDPITKTVSLIPRASALTEPLVDWREMTTRSYQLIPKTGREGHSFIWKKDENDAEWVENASHQDLVIGDGKEKKEARWAPLFEHRGANPISKINWLVASLNQPGISSAFGIAEPSSSRLFFNRGMQSAQNGVDLYPMSGFGTLDILGASVGSWSLKWDGADGLVKTWWEAWLETLTAKDLDIAILLDVADIAQIEYFAPYLVRAREGWVKGILIDIAVDMSTTGIEPARVKFAVI